MAPAIHSAKGNSLVALATRDLEKANKFLELSDRLVVYNDYNDLLEDSNVDAVYIPLPIIFILNGQRAVCKLESMFCVKSRSQWLRTR